MYNFNKISELLSERNISKKQFFESIGMGPTTRFSLLNRDVRVSTIEKIADFFNVPIDYFFDRNLPKETLNVVGSRNQLSNININSVIDSNCHYQNLIKEKDERINLLEEMVELLKSTYMRKDVSDESRTNSN